MSSGLEGVVVADTRLSKVDGAKGKLVIGGQPVERFASRGFEGAATALLGECPDLSEGRKKARQTLEPVLSALKGRAPMEGLRLGLSALGTGAGEAEIIGAFPIILGALRHGEGVRHPDPDRSHVDDLLCLYQNKSRVSASLGKGLSTYLATVSEHGMNASTFTARVVASTKASRLDAVVSALGALSGPLHGGAPGPVLDLLDSLKEVDDLESNLASRVRKGERLMGFGHRVYRTRDPRAAVLKQAVERLQPTARLQHAQRVEQAAVKVLAELKPHRPLHTNVEFYTAVLLEHLGFDRSVFTALFATGRVLGWLAHYREQTLVGRLIRPCARYVGPEPDPAGVC